MFRVADVEKLARNDKPNFATTPRVAEVVMVLQETSRVLVGQPIRLDRAREREPVVVSARLGRAHELGTRLEACARNQEQSWSGLWSARFKACRGETHHRWQVFSCAVVLLARPPSRCGGGSAF